MADSPRIEELRRRVQKDPASIAFAQLAEEYRRAGRFGEAIETCESGLARHPGYLSARVTLGRALLETGNLDGAQTELKRVLRAAPENLAALRGLAEIHHRRGDLRQALEHYRAALEFARQDPELTQRIEEIDRQLGPAPAAVADGLSFEEAQKEILSFAQDFEPPAATPVLSVLEETAAFDAPLLVEAPAEGGSPVPAGEAGSAPLAPPDAATLPALSVADATQAESVLPVPPDVVGPGCGEVPAPVQPEELAPVPVDLPPPADPGEPPAVHLGFLPPVSAETRPDAEPPALGAEPPPPAPSGGAAASPGTRDDAQAEPLERWLEAILADREERRRRN